MLQVDYFASTARGILLASPVIPRGQNQIPLCGLPVPDGALAVVEVAEAPVDARIRLLEVIEPASGASDAWQTREVSLQAGLRLVVAIGGRFANRSVSGYPPDHPVPVGGYLDLLNSGGVAGIAANREQPLVKLRVLGGVEFHNRHALLADFRMIPPAIAPLDEDEPPETPLVMVMGSDMEVGKTTCAASLALSLRAAGIKTSYAKLTGTGRMRDLMRVCYGRPLGYFDSARQGWDFVDAGMATTFPADPERVRQNARILLRYAESRSEIVVAEIADAPYSEGSIDVATDCWILSWIRKSGLVICACDAGEVAKPIDWITRTLKLEKRKLLISGRAANDSTLARELESTTGVSVIGCIAPSTHSPQSLRTAGGAMADWVIRHVMDRRKVVE